MSSIPAIPTPPRDIRLYILMRCDLGSMNPGKAVAQGSHAANQCLYEARDKPAVDALVREWEATACGFGTAITCAVNERDMRAVVAQLRDAGHHAAVVHDPTYPVTDGKVIHLIPLDTCAYGFGLASDLAPFLSRFPLMD